jgi:hypothetical protein
MWVQAISSSKSPVVMFVFKANLVHAAGLSIFFSFPSLPETLLTRLGSSMARRNLPHFYSNLHLVQFTVRI